MKEAAKDLVEHRRCWDDQSKIHHPRCRSFPSRTRYVRCPATTQLDQGVAAAGSDAAASRRRSSSGNNSTDLLLQPHVQLRGRAHRRSKRYTRRTAPGTKQLLDCRIPRGMCDQQADAKYAELHAVGAASEILPLTSNKDTAASTRSTELDAATAAPPAKSAPRGPGTRCRRTGTSLWPRRRRSRTRLRQRQESATRSPSS